MKRGLQIALAILSLIPAGFGFVNTVLGAGRFLPADAVNAAIDSQFRFQSAWYFGLAMLIWWMIPQIEQRTMLFRIVVLSLFAGGLARLYSYLTVGPPPTMMVAGMALELCLPLLLIWQSKVAAAHRSDLSS